MSEDRPNKKDKVIADSGWGIKPDDQPANADDAGEHAINECQYDATDPDAVKTILRHQRQGFNLANRVVIKPGQVTIYDVNNDSFRIHGLSYGDKNLIELLNVLGVTFDPVKLGSLGTDYNETREYPISRVWAWGAERTG